MICIHKLYKVAVKYRKLFSAIILLQNIALHPLGTLYHTQIVQICTDCVRSPIPFHSILVMRPTGRNSPYLPTMFYIYMHIIILYLGHAATLY